MRETEVHHFIEELVHDHEVVATGDAGVKMLPNALFVKNAKVILENSDKVVQELHNHRHVHVSF